MRIPESAELITITLKDDDFGVPKKVETSRKVYGSFDSLSASEIFEGGRNGLNPEIRFRMVEIDYDDETKAMILGDFLPVLKGSGDPLETHIEDILATAKLMEVRIYPKEEWLYVRVEVKFLAETAKWSRPYQMLAAWDCFNELKGYVFPVGKGRRSELPIELENPENAAQREMRSLLRSERIAAAGKEGRQ